jgi:hypothetical protein
VASDDMDRSEQDALVEEVIVLGECSMRLDDRQGIQSLRTSGSP